MKIYFSRLFQRKFGTTSLHLLIPISALYFSVVSRVDALLSIFLYTSQDGFCIVATISLVLLVSQCHKPNAWDAAISESAKVLGGFLLGLPHTATYFGHQFFSCGPMWYLVALMLAWVLLDVLLEIFPERYITPAVVGVTLLGWGVTLVWEAPFCIAQGMVSLPYLYIGYLAKKRRLFETPLSGRAKAGLIVSALGVVAGVLLTQSTDCVSLGEWTMGPLSILLDGAVGYGIIRLFLKWQRRVDGPISHAIEWVGRRSLFIFCIHTVELTAIPWYLMAAKYADHPVQGMLLQFVFSLVSIFAVTELLMRRKELGRKLRGGKPADKPRQRSRTRRYAAKH